MPHGPYADSAGKKGTKTNQSSRIANKVPWFLQDTGGNFQDIFFRICTSSLIPGMCLLWNFFSNQRQMFLYTKSRIMHITGTVVFWGHRNCKFIVCSLHDVLFAWFTICHGVNWGKKRRSLAIFWSFLQTQNKVLFNQESVSTILFWNVIKVTSASFLYIRFGCGVQCNNLYQSSQCYC